MVAALLGDITLETYVHGSGYGRHKSYLDSILNSQPHSFRTALSRSLKTGEIEKVINNKGQACLRLSPRGAGNFIRMFPLSRLKSKGWDGKWRIVIFDIPESKRGYRDKLRVDLIMLGFGKLQESIYITPLDILVDLREMLKTKGYGEWVMVFEAEQKLTSQAYRTASLVWPIDKLNDEYGNLIAELEYQKNNVTLLKDKEKTKEKFYNLLSKDPFLPKELLPDDWKGDVCQKLMLQID